MVKKFGILAFKTTQRAIFSETVLQKYFEVETIPTPREISSECGLCIKFDLIDLDEILEKISQEKLTISGAYIVEKIGRKKLVEEVIYNAD